MKKVKKTLKNQIMVMFIRYVWGERQFYTFSGTKLAMQHFCCSCQLK